MPQPTRCVWCHETVLTFSISINRAEFVTLAMPAQDIVMPTQYKYSSHIRSVGKIYPLGHKLTKTLLPPNVFTLQLTGLPTPNSQVHQLASSTTHQLTNSTTHQLTNSTTHQLINPSTCKLTYSQFTSSLTHKLTNSRTYKLINSTTHQLINSSTYKLKNPQTYKLKNRQHKSWNPCLLLYKTALSFVPF